MTATIVVGMQWGDEGKGKVVDAFAHRTKNERPAYEVIARYQGGPNAGHTVVVDGVKKVLHAIPSGILHPRILNICGNGVVIDLEEICKEIDDLRHAGVNVNNLRLSHRAHVIMPCHKSLEQIASTSKKIDTTRRGIGPCYTDKVAREGLRLCDLFSQERASQIITSQCQEYNKKITKESQKQGLSMLLPYDVINEAYELFERIKSLIADTSKIIYDALQSGKDVLLEGAQGAMLDVDHGTYPYVTSSTTTAGGACSGAGISPREITDIVGILKAYTTRVGEGPFPTELKNGAGLRLQTRGAERGATTGRERRCGWLDLVQAKYANRINGATELALMKLDVLDTEPEINVCVGYECGGRQECDMPYELGDVTPVYKSLKGWQTLTANCRSWHELPQEAKEYVGFIEENLGVPVKLISVGSDRNQTILR